MPSGGSRLKLGDKCRDCKQELTSYNVMYKGLERYIMPRCKFCYPKHRDSVPSRSKKSRALNWIEWKWKISPIKYGVMEATQLGGCAICKQKPLEGKKLAVDHDHRTGVIRDLLCNRCNLILGLLNDDDGLLIDIVEYLKRHSRKVA